MAGGGGAQETKTEISPDFKPYITYGLEKTKSALEGMPEVPSNLAAPMSATTSQALDLARQRAIAGSPLLSAAQQEQLATIQGRGLNPYLADAASALYRPTTMAAQESIRGLQSKASSAGRYGSGAMEQLGEKTGYNIGLGLGDIYKQLAYNSSEAERARQVAASQLAPTLGAADYSDIEKLLRIGQGEEGYAQKQIEGALAAAERPAERIQRAVSSFYGAPLETTTTATPTGGK
jgi:hypothetical protein